jgi:phage N-6-adenine-methyltransferase
MSSNEHTDDWFFGQGVSEAVQASFGFQIEAPKEHDNSEWYTPKNVIDLARKTLERIDFDPASCALAQETVQATEYRTREDSGLRDAWHGRVWLNPPYGRYLINAFARKLRESVAQMQVEQALFLTNNCTETEWWQKTLGVADQALFIKGRIKFNGPMAKGNSPTQGQTIMHFANHQDETERIKALVRFYRNFSEQGFIYHKNQVFDPVLLIQEMRLQLSLVSEVYTAKKALATCDMLALFGGEVCRDYARDKREQYASKGVLF